MSLCVFVCVCVCMCVCVRGCTCVCVRMSVCGWTTRVLVERNLFAAITDVRCFGICY